MSLVGRALVLFSFAFSLLSFAPAVIESGQSAVAATPPSITTSSFVDDRSTAVHKALFGAAHFRIDTPATLVEPSFAVDNTLVHQPQINATFGELSNSIDGRNDPLLTIQ